MKITPLEIRQKTFEKVFRGYEKDEVNAYLQSLSMEWERLLDENKELYQRIENLETESSKLRELESSLFKTLKTAEDTGATLIEQAKKETDLKMRESQIQAESVLNDARSKAKKLVENAEAKKKQIIEDMINHVKIMEGLFNDMIDLKEKVVGQVKSYSTDLMGRIEKLEKKSEGLQIQDIVAEAKKIYNASMVGESTDFIDDTDDKKELENTEQAESEEVSSEAKEESLEKEDTSKKNIAVKEDIEIEVEDIITETESTKEDSIVEEESPEQEDKSMPEEVLEEEKPEENTLKTDEGEGADIEFEDNKKEKNTTKSFFDEIE